MEGRGKEADGYAHNALAKVQEEHPSLIGTLLQLLDIGKRGKMTKSAMITSKTPKQY